jgi:glycosyltransferase involved in cell wall biosynthesis
LLLSVSVLIPTYNYAERITEAIESVLIQSYPSSLIEIIVVDDGSTDNTREVLDHLISNEIIKYHYQINKGKASATTKAISESKGRIIFCLDADDLFLPDKIKKTVQIFETNPNVVHVSTPALIKYKNGNSTKEKIPEFLLDQTNIGLAVLNYFFRNNMLFGGGSTFSCIDSVIKNAVIPDAVNMYIDELLVILALNKGDTHFISEPLSIWNVHDQNYSVYRSNDYNQIQKNKSLLASSKTILAYLNMINIEANLKKLYFLKHQVRLIHLAEIENKKSFKKVVILFINCFLYKIYPFSVYCRYKIFNRFIPTFLIRIIKNVKFKNNLA